MFDKLKEFYAYSKSTLNRSRYYYNLFVLPIVAVLGLLDLLIAFILLMINSQKFLIPTAIMFLVLVVALLGCLIALPFVRKQEIKDEATRIENFFESKLLKNPEHEYILPKMDEGGTVPLVFSKTGLTIGGIAYTYDGFDCALFTSNYKYHANLIIVFNRNEEGDKQDGDNEGVKSFSLPLDINMLSIIDEFNIKIINSDVLAFIKDNPNIAAKQILKYGKIQKNYDKYKVK